LLRERNARYHGLDLTIGGSHIRFTETKEQTELGFYLHKGKVALAGPAHLF